MATLAENLAHNLAYNLTAIRARGQLSQAQLSTLAGIPRSTITHMESGAGNPSLTNLAAIAAALQVTIEELLAPPRNEISLTAADRIVVKAAGGLKLHKLVSGPTGSFEMNRIELRPGAKLTGTPHRRGTKEYLYVLKGAVTVGIAGESPRVAAGELLVFPADQVHTYRNGERTIADALSLVIAVPPGR